MQVQPTLSLGPHILGPWTLAVVLTISEIKRQEKAYSDQRGGRREGQVRDESKEEDGRELCVKRTKDCLTFVSLVSSKQCGHAE